MKLLIIHKLAADVGLALCPLAIVVSCPVQCVRGRRVDLREERLKLLTTALYIDSHPVNDASQREAFKLITYTTTGGRDPSLDYKITNDRILNNIVVVIMDLLVEWDQQTTLEILKFINILMQSSSVRGSRVIALYSCVMRLLLRQKRIFHVTHSYYTRLIPRQGCIAN